MPLGALPFVLGTWLAFFAYAMAQPATAPECSDWRACRQQVEEAIESGAYERALDLAWRAVQRGPRDDAGLMFLLARAQCLSGRPQDALVMIRRIAERGVATEAATHPDLARTRALPDWADVEVVVARANAGGLSAAASVSPAAKPAATPSGGSKRPGPGPDPGRRAPAASVTVDDAARFSSDHFVASGLAYDTVSHRYLFGDRDGRKLRVVGDGLDHAVDLVRAESAGFLDVRALAIDPKRGDLWVASANAEGTSATLHKLQLVSGRPLLAVPFAAEEAPVIPVDLAVTDEGAVLALDRDGGLHRLRPGGSSIERVVRLQVERATSLAPAASDGVWFVAHEAGLSRVDLPSRGVIALGSPKSISLAAFERIRAYREGLVGIQAASNGTRRIVRLELNGSRRSVRSATTFDPPIEANAGPAFLAVSGDELSFITTGEPPQPETGAPSGGAAELVVRRLRLR